MRAPDGAAIAPFDLWQGTMMANAARDPLWRAYLSAEVARRPAARERIEAKCLTCHAPAATAERRQHGGALRLSDLDPRAEPQLAEVAREGVSCTICHGIEAAGLGSDASFSGGWTIGHEQVAYGPYTDPFLQPMRNLSGWSPVHGAHIRDSALCGSCHTLFTETLDPDGKPTGTVFAEQTPYLEWRASAYSTERDDPGPEARSCQECHLPRTDASGAPISTMIARMPRGGDFPRTVPRTPYGQHHLVGGNALVPEILAAHREELGVTASEEALRATAARAREQLAERTARIRISGSERAPGRVSFVVEVESLAGHKVPTGHPTRRMWLHVRVLAAGETLIEIGASDRDGRLLDASGAPLPSESVGGPVLAWPAVVRGAADVPIFEQVMADEAGAPTWSLLSAASAAKDTRLLPKGWDPRGRAAQIGAVGVPEDGSFAGGRAVVRYELDLPPEHARGELVIEAALRYQTIGARSAAELAAIETPETRRFAKYLDERGNAPERVAETVERSPPVAR